MFFNRIIISLSVVMLIPFCLFTMPSPCEARLRDVQEAFKMTQLPNSLLMLTCTYYDEDKSQPINIIDLSKPPLVAPCSYVYDHTSPPSGFFTRFHQPPTRLSSAVNITCLENGDLGILLTNHSGVRISLPDGKFLLPESGTASPAMDQMLMCQEGHCYVASSLVWDSAENQCYIATVIDDRRYKHKVKKPLDWVDPNVEYQEWYKEWRLGAGQPRTKIEIRQQSLAKMLGLVALKKR
jgi:hypothetical protein